MRCLYFISFISAIAAVLVSCGGGGGGPSGPSIKYLEDVYGNPLSRSNSTISVDNSFFTVRFSEKMDDDSVKGGITMTCGSNAVTLTITTEDSITYTIATNFGTILPQIGDTCSLEFDGTIKSAGGEALTAVEYALAVVSGDDQQAIFMARVIATSGALLGAVDLHLSFTTAFFAVLEEIGSGKMDGRVELSDDGTSGIVYYATSGTPDNLTVTMSNLQTTAEVDNFSPPSFDFGGLTITPTFTKSTPPHLTLSMKRGRITGSLSHQTISSITMTDVVSEGATAVVISDGTNNNYEGTVSYKGSLVSSFEASLQTISYTFSHTERITVRYNEKNYSCTGAAGTLTYKFKGEGEFKFTAGTNVSCVKQ